MNSDPKSSERPQYSEINPGLLPYLPGFYKDRLAELEKIKNFQQIKDFDGLKRMAHSWKGFCSNYGFAYLGTLAAEMEKLLLEEEAISDKLIAYINEIERYLMSLKDDPQLQPK